ncbi:DDE-type integrase/transposase/recombinase [Archangium violaceum]|uniref:DDE-type integrase/transposase/recombinase n=1 Tax=Archangium violaceum TaxID=83451 RepID=UPI0037BEE68D
MASESTFYRVLREHEQLHHSGRARPPLKRERPEHVASAPNQVWSWDITYLRGPVRGAFLYLYLVVDVYSRSVMGW